MIRETICVGLLQCNCTILGDESSREAIVVDPGADIPHVIAVLKKHHLAVRHIVVTHAHIDHIAGAVALKRLTGAPIHYNQRDLPLVALMDVQAGWIGSQVPEVAPPDNSPSDTDVISIAGLDAHVLLTPGHTEGSLSLHLPAQNVVLAGDTLFAGSIGRTDLPGGNYRTLIGSIREKLLSLPGDTVVIPGHGRDTTIGEEREHNPFLAS